ncbi:MAG: hypothetical protein JF597_51085 [Streptomyces sp.]|uniref:hypothetical protein n=1 Tax=Streptomyces sp. TaxID=1931 RepID=UPI0025D07CD6|nr:hypothetical protein [Streptomyces sp.]MBW8801590.1 hypothetical protein [Streptomyces sp.]
MTTDDPSVPDGHPRLRHLREQLTEHHRRSRAEREEAELEAAVGAAAFDLGTDIAHPAPGHAEAAYDVDADIGADPRPPSPSALPRTASKERT